MCWPRMDDAARQGAWGCYPGRGERVEQVSRIAVLRANAVGDLVVALPALAALRRAYPQAEISLLGREWHARFLRGRPAPVDEVVVLPETLSLGAADGDELDRNADFLAAMRLRRFDLALQLHGGGRYSNRVVLALGARLSAGLCAPGAPRLDRVLPYRQPHGEVLRLLEAVALVGARGVDVEPRLAVTPADREEAARVLGEVAPGPGGRPLLVLQPGCQDPRRAWRPEAFAAVGDHFAALGARVVLNGSAQERALLGRVRAAMREPATALAGLLSLGGLLGLLAQARLLVTNDTGTAHLARALDVPNVTVCWIGNLVAYGPMSSARHAVAVSWQLHCPRCGRLNVAERCPHDDSFVDAVHPGEVLALARPLWSASD